MKKLGIFARIPAPGRVKRRLTPPLSPEQAARLYGAFLNDLLRRLAKLKKVRTIVYYTGGEEADMARWVPAGFSLRRQADGSLGERLAAAFDDLFDDNTHSAVVIGTDSPDLPLRTIKRAFYKLRHKDVALGPATDGGYYLVGLRRPAPAVFEGVPWGEPGVFGRTLERVDAGGLSLTLLPVWYDVDNIRSVRLLRSLIEARRLEGGPVLDATLRVLESLDLDTVESPGD